MKNFIALLILYLMRLSLWFRYKVTVKGTEHLNPKELNKAGGVLFLPNHPTVFVDPTLVTLAIWKKYPIRPVIVEYMYYTPGVHALMKFMDALPIPDFVTTSNSLKKKKADQALEKIIACLKSKENFLIYPAGKTKRQAHEVIGASGVHRILQSVPEVNVVLVRTTGLWGSKFSRALTKGGPPDMFGTIFWGIKVVLKNLIFFTPRRHVTIEFSLPPADFPYQGTRIELNRYLERWYNRPDGILPQIGEEPGESLYLISYSMWKKEIPVVEPAIKKEVEVDLQKIPLKVQEKVKQKLSEISQILPEQIMPEMDLAGGLGLDSLDLAEILTFLDDQFHVSGVPVNALTSVGKVMAIAAKQISFEGRGRRDCQSWPLVSATPSSTCSHSGRDNPSRSFLERLPQMGEAGGLRRCNGRCFDLCRCQVACGAIGRVYSASAGQIHWHHASF